MLEQRIGSGGMGEVWRARHRQQQVAVAVKVLTASGSSRLMFVESFRNEVRAAAALDHPHVAMVLDYGAVPPEAARRSQGELVEGTPYLGMELVEGDTLADHMGTLDWPEVERVLRGLLDALAHAHARGVIHRDLKLSNVLYDPRSGRFKLTDFGIAHAIAQTGDPFRWGTPAYMPPEQLLGRWWDYGPWTDLYSLGCCAFGLVTGERPFSDEVSGSAAQRRLPPLRPLVPVPDGFEEWLQQLCDPEPAARYQLAADAAWALHLIGQSFTPAQLFAAARAGKPKLPDDHTTTLSFDLPDSDDEVTLVPQRPSPTRLPPIPSSWRRRRAQRPSVRLVGAGLGLYGLRRIPMIGRAEERDRLWDALRDIRSRGVARAVVVQGPAGCGTTRLGEWLAERAHEVGAASVLHAVHGPGGGASDGLAGMLARYLRTGGLSQGQLRQRVGDALEVGGQPVDPWEVRGILEMVAPEPGQPSVFGAPAERHAVVRRFVERQARRRPVLLFLDDVQWGLDTLELAHSLLEAQRHAPFPALVLLVARDEALAEQSLERSVLDEIQALPGTQRMHVGPLSVDHHRSLVEELLRLEGGLARLVEERTAGNPMFAVQLVGDWVERGILIPGPRGFELRPGAEVHLPDDLYATWAERIDDLLRDRPEHDRSALELAAILGHRVMRGEWRSACVELGVEPSGDLVDALMSRRLAQPDDAGAAGSWAFAHSMLRETLARQSEEAGRAPALHRACAAMLAAAGAPSRERLARHLLGSGALDAALDPLVDAIESRCRAGEFDRADALLDLWEDAVGRLKLPDGDARWVRGLRAAAAVHRYKDRPEQMLATCDRLERGVRTAGWPADLLAYVRMQQGRLARMSGDFSRAVDLFREGLQLAQDPLTRATLHARIGQTLVNLGAFAGAQAEFRACLELSRSGADEVGTGDAWIGLAGIALHQGDLDDATRSAARARDAYRAARHRWGLAVTSEIFGEIARHRQSWDEAIHCYRTSAEIWSVLGTESAALYSEVNIALVEVERGNAAGVRDELERCAARAKDFGNRSLWAVLRLAQLVGDAQDGRQGDWLRHASEAGTALQDTQFLSPDVALMAEQAGRAAREAGWEALARDVFELAQAQWVRLGREEDADRVGWLLE